MGILEGGNPDEQMEQFDGRVRVHPARLQVKQTASMPSKTLASLQLSEGSLQNKMVPKDTICEHGFAGHGCPECRQETIDRIKKRFEGRTPPADSPDCDLIPHCREGE